VGRPTLAEGLALAMLAVLVALPLGIGPYPVRVATVIFMWAALAGAWNLLAGYAGSTDLGPVVHYGVGAFATAETQATTRESGTMKSPRIRLCWKYGIRSIR
jgi:ABC-type branched-subunit amino acid transport system permease subunit